jgi:hypothetical protein
VLRRLRYRQKPIKLRGFLFSNEYRNRFGP